MQALRRVVAVTTLPSKSRKEELAAELGLSFSQVSLFSVNVLYKSGLLVSDLE
jgi:hypothetical protein